MATILGVHGAFHEMWGPTQILRRWQPALQDGVLIAGGTLPSDSVSVAFYGDIFRHDPSDGALDDDALRALARASGLADVAQQMLGPDAASVLAQALGEDMLRRTVDQVGHYFGDDQVRADVRARVADAVQPDTRVVVAHSLGSIVAYDCLRAHPEWTGRDVRDDRIAARQPPARAARTSKRTRAGRAVCGAGSTSPRRPTRCAPDPISRGSTTRASRTSSSTTAIVVTTRSRICVRGRPGRCCATRSDAEPSRGLGRLIQQPAGVGDGMMSG